MQKGLLVTWTARDADPENMVLDSKSNDEEGKYFTKYEGYSEDMECDYVCFESKFEFENL